MGGCYSLAPLKANNRTGEQRLIMSAFHNRKLLPALVMLFALAGLSLSVTGEARSHGLADLSGGLESQLGGHSDGHSGHGHSHDSGEKPETSPHHDAGNHTHETVDQLTISLIQLRFAALRQPVPFAGDSPRSLRYRLDRPPKGHLPA